VLTSLASFKSKAYRKALEESFMKIDQIMQTERAHRELMKLAHKENSEVGTMAGCTATVCLITESEIWCCNAGDSRTVLSKAKSALPLSRDHKPNEPDEKKRIYAACSFVENTRVQG